MRCHWSILALLAFVTLGFMAAEPIHASQRMDFDAFIKIDGISEEIPVKGFSWGTRKAASIGQFDTNVPTASKRGFSIVIEKGIASKVLSEAVKTNKSFALAVLVIRKGGKIINEFKLFELSANKIKATGSFEEVTFNFGKIEW